MADPTFRTSTATSFAHLYAEAARRNAPLPAVFADTEIVSHRDLMERVRAAAFRMAELGVTRGSLIAVNSGDRLATLTCLLASSLLGAGYVTASKVLARAKAIEPTHFFRTADARGNRRRDFVLIDERWQTTAQTRSRPDAFEGPASIDDPWIYLHTSGTTGTPKFGVLSEAMVCDRSRAVADNFPYRATVLSMSFAAGSRPFFARALAALLQGCAIVTDPSPDAWVAHGTTVVCGSPGQILYLLRDRQLERQIPSVEVSGAKLTFTMIRDLLINFSRVVDVYGATETNKSFETIYRRDVDGEITVEAAPRPDVAVEIVTNDGQPVPPGGIGSVRVRNGYMTGGYLNAPDATTRAFRDGWFYPGDLATWGEAGELVVVGREDDVINLGGYKMNAGMLDMFFSGIPGVKEAIAFRNPKPRAVDLVLAWLVLEPNALDSEVIALACEAAKVQLGVLMMPSAMRVVQTIPRTPDGDPDRKACVSAVRARAGMGDEDTEDPGYNDASTPSGDRPS